MDSSIDKYAVYKVAPPLERVNMQGKLNKSSGESHLSNYSVTSIGSRHDSQTSDHSGVLSYVGNQSSDGSESSPRSPLLPHTTGYHTTDYTHSLSLSDAGSPPPSVTSEHQQSPTALVLESSSESVLAVRALDSSPSHSPSVKTISTRTLSPVKVTRHFYEGDDEAFTTDIAAIAPPDQLPSTNWRRFSSSFVASVKSSEGPPTSEHSDTGNQKDRTINTQAVAQQQSHDPGDQSNGPNLSTIIERSPDNTPNDDRIVDSESVGGVGRSVSDHGLMRSKQQDVPVHSRSMDAGSTRPKISAASTNKKAPKGRHISARYMSDTASARRPPPSQSGRGKATPLKTSLYKAPKSKTNSRLPPHKPPDSRTHRGKPPPPAVRTPHPSTPSHNLSSLSVSFSPSGLVTSTPSRTYGGGNDGSFIAMDTGNDSIMAPGDSLKKRSTKGEIDELEVLYTRLLETTHLNALSARSMKEQEQEAMRQLYSLWKGVEDKKCDTRVELKKTLDTARGNLALDKTMEVQLQGLGPVVSILAHLERSYVAMARALDATRHDMDLCGILPIDEGQLMEKLAECEDVLGDIMMDIRPKLSNVASFAESTDAVVATLDKELEQLERCSDSLETVTKQQLHDTSIYLECEQRTT